MANPMASKFAESFNRDWQQKACYAWEAYCLDYFAAKVDDQTAIQIIRDIAIALRFPIPHIDWRGKGRGRAHIATGRITLCHGDINWLTPHHEAAHIFTKPFVGHGPQFVRNYIHILARFANLQNFKAGDVMSIEEKLFNSAVEHGVCVSQHIDLVMPSEKHITKGHDLTDLYDLL